MPKRIDALLRWLIATVMMMLLASGASADSYENSLSSARLGDTRQLVELLNRGIDPDTIDAQGNTLLILAAGEGHADTVATLLRYRPSISQRNFVGDSALMIAVLRGHVEIVDLLLDAGAAVDHDGWTPLMYAAFEGHVEMLDRLLARGADVNALAPNQSNALMLAARNGHLAVVRRLLETDVDLEHRNDRGFTAETWATANGNTHIAELINAERGRRAARTMRIEIR